MALNIDLKKFKEDLERAIDELSSAKTLTPIAKQTAEIIRRRTRLGQGVEETGAKKSPLAPLAASTKASRKKKSKQGKLSDKTSPNKSNLTESGEMLDSIAGRAMNRLIEISPTGARNKKLAAYHQLGRSSPSAMPARKFLNLSAEDIRQLTAVMQDEFTNILNRVFRK